MPIPSLTPFVAALAMTSAPGQSPNAFNPKISLVGDFAFRLKDDDKTAEHADFREVELGFAADVDPFLKAEAYLAIEKENGESHINVEEAFGQYDQLGRGLSGKFGRIAAAIGRTNRNHRDQLSFLDYPLVTTDLLGEEGLRAGGASISYLMPGDRYLDFTLEGVDAEDGPLFSGSRTPSPVWVGHARTFFDFSPDLSAQFGVSAANGPSMAGRSNVVGTDFTMKWQPGKQGRSLLFETEAYWADSAAPGAPKTFGMFADMEYQVSRNWFAGVRYDSSEIPGTADSHIAWTANVTRKVTEFEHWRLEFKQIASNYESLRSTLTLQFQWLIGTHPAHKY
jgi:hypothetical protein